METRQDVNKIKEDMRVVKETGTGKVLGVSRSCSATTKGDPSDNKQQKIDEKYAIGWSNPIPLTTTISHANYTSNRLASGSFNLTNGSSGSNSRLWRNLILVWIDFSGSMAYRDLAKPY